MPSPSFKNRFNPAAALLAELSTLLELLERRWCCISAAGVAAVDVAVVVVGVVVDSVAMRSLVGERKVGVSAVGEGRVVVSATATGAEEVVVRRAGSVGGEADVVGAGQEVCSVGARVRKSVGRVGLRDEVEE